MSMNRTTVQRPSAPKRKRADTASASAVSAGSTRLQDGRGGGEEPPRGEPAARSATARRQTYASASKSDTANNTHALYNNGEPRSIIDIRTPETREEAYEIADCLLKGHSVTINLEVINRELASRILDFLSGVTYACGGELIKVTKTTWMVTPGDVGVNRQGFLSDTENNDAFYG